MNEGGVLGSIQEQLAVDRQRGSHTETLARAVVDLIGDSVKLLLAVDG